MMMNVGQCYPEHLYLLLRSSISGAVKCCNADVTLLARNTSYVIIEIDDNDNE
jgi:hypothetical protein